MFLYHIHIDALLHPVTHRRRIYILNNGSQLDIDSQPAWCYCCKRFVEAEKIDSVAELDRQIAELQHFRDSPGHIPPDRTVRIHRLPELLLRRTWRAHRENPPRCLECRSTNLPRWTNQPRSQTCPASVAARSPSFDILECRVRSVRPTRRKG